VIFFNIVFIILSTLSYQNIGMNFRL
jgi:hypothetical protein